MHLFRSCPLWMNSEEELNWFNHNTWHKISTISRKRFKANTRSCLLAASRGGCRCNKLEMKMMSWNERTKNRGWMLVAYATSADTAINIKVDSRCWTVQFCSVLIEGRKIRMDRPYMGCRIIAKLQFMSFSFYTNFFHRFAVDLLDDIKCKF